MAAANYVVAGSSPGVSPPADLAQAANYEPDMTADFDKTVTAMVRKDILTNLREVSRWLVPGAYIAGRIVAGTNKIRHIAYADLTPGTDIINAEGVPPTEVALSIGYTEYGVTQKGALVGISDVALALSPHELMSVAAERVAYKAKMTIDQSVSDAVLAGTGISATGITVTGGLTGANIRAIVAKLKAAHVPTFPDGFYIGIIHPNVVYDLQGDTSIGGWIEASKYADPSRLLNGEIGRIYGVRFIETSIGTAGAAANQYDSVFFGPDYFAFGDLQSVQTYMVRPGGDHSDPLGQKALVGYKGMWGAKTLEVAAAGGPRFLKLVNHAGVL